MYINWVEGFIHYPLYLVINLHNNSIRYIIKYIAYIKISFYIQIAVGWLLYFWLCKTSKIGLSYILL